MLDIGWTELLIIGIVALIVVGPKDLPGLFRNLGKFMARIRSMGRDFQRAMENAADESGVKDVAREFKDAASGKDLGVDELKDVAKGPKHWKSKVKAGLKGDEPSDEEAAEATEPEAPSKPRGTETEKLAKSRAAESAERRAQAAARRDAAKAGKADADKAGGKDSGNAGKSTPAADGDAAPTPPDETAQGGSKQDDA